MVFFRHIGIAHPRAFIFFNAMGISSQARVVLFLNSNFHIYQCFNPFVLSLHGSPSNKKISFKKKRFCLCFVDTHKTFLFPPTRFPRLPVHILLLPLNKATVHFLTVYHSYDIGKFLLFFFPRESVSTAKQGNRYKCVLF